MRCPAPAHLHLRSCRHISLPRQIKAFDLGVTDFRQRLLKSGLTYSLYLSLNSQTCTRAQWKPQMSAAQSQGTMQDRQSRQIVSPLWCSQSCGRAGKRTVRPASPLCTGRASESGHRWTSTLCGQVDTIKSVLCPSNMPLTPDQVVCQRSQSRAHPVTKAGRHSGRCAHFVYPGREARLSPTLIELCKGSDRA